MGVRDPRVGEARFGDVGEGAGSAGEAVVLEERAAEQGDAEREASGTLGEGEGVVEAGRPRLLGERRLEPGLERDARFGQAGGQRVEVGGRVPGGDGAPLETAERQPGGPMMGPQQLDRRARLLAAVGPAEEERFAGRRLGAGRREEARRGGGRRLHGLLLGGPASGQRRGGIPGEEEEVQVSRRRQRAEELVIADAAGLVSDDADLGPRRRRGGREQPPPREVEVERVGSVELVAIVPMDPFEPGREPQQPRRAVVEPLVLSEGPQRAGDQRPEGRTAGVRDPVARLLVEQPEQRPGEPQRVPRGRSLRIRRVEQRVLHHQRARERGGERAGRVGALEKVRDGEGRGTHRRKLYRGLPAGEQTPPDRVLERSARPVRPGEDQQPFRVAPGLFGEVRAQRAPVGKPVNPDPARCRFRGGVHRARMIRAGCAISRRHRGAPLDNGDLGVELPSITRISGWSSPR